MSGNLYLDDLSVGMQFDSPTASVTESEIKRFASEYDPQPFHLDEEAAKVSVFSGLVASGWHTAAITMRLLVSGGLPLAGGVVGMSVEITWSKPVRPNAVLHVISTIRDIKLSKSKPGTGIVTVESQTLDASGEPVQRLISRLLVKARNC
jgi:acyl dehydratase